MQPTFSTISRFGQWLCIKNYLRDVTQPPALSDLAHAHSSRYSTVFLSACCLYLIKKNFKVEVHEFGPLPPSPVDEFDTYSELFHPASQPMRRKADTLPEPFYRCDLGSDPGGQFLHRPPEPPPHSQEAASGSLKARGPEPVSNSLKTRSMDAGFARGPKAYCNGSRREVRQRHPSVSDIETTLAAPLILRLEFKIFSVASFIFQFSYSYSNLYKTLNNSEKTTFQLEAAGSQVPTLIGNFSVVGDLCNVGQLENKIT